MKICTYNIDLPGLFCEGKDEQPGLVVIHDSGYTAHIQSRRKVLDAGGAILFVHGVRPPQSLQEADLREDLRQYLPRVHAFMGNYHNDGPRLTAYLRRVDAIRLGGDMDWHSLDPERPPTVPLEGEIVYEDNFDTLWRFEKELKGAWVIKGSVAPAKVNVGGIRVDEYLTAYDWAVAAMLRTAGSPQPARIVILDDKGETLGRKRFEDFKHILERVVQVNGEPGKAAAWNLNPAERDLLRRNWAMNVCEPSGDHHAIYNLVGAELLLGGMDPKYTPKVPALKELLRISGLVPPQSQIGLPWYPLPTNVESVVLIDDLAGFGWEQFLKKALGTERVHSIEVVGDEILGKAERALRERTRLSFTGSPKELVFLDLRLFATLGASKEREFFKKAAELIGRLELPWQEDLKLAGKFTDGAPRESNEYHVALTLLPRLLAAADPTLPIVLFSSTGRNSILKRFDGFPNLVARHFEKPQFNGSAVTDMAIETQSKFVHAMQRVERLAKGRAACVDLPSSGLSRTALGYADIFIDECGSGNDRYFAVGGLLLFSPQRNTVRNVGSALRDAPEIDGTRKMVWGISEQVGPHELADPVPAGNDHLPKDPAVSTAEILLPPIARLLQSKDVDVHAFTLYEAFDAPSKRGPEFQKNNRQDNRYRYLLTEHFRPSYFPYLQSGT